MATITRYKIVRTYIDAKSRDTEVSFYVSQADFLGYVDGTAPLPVQNLIDGIDAMTDLAPKGVNAQREVYDTAVTPPATALRGNKAVIQAVSALGTPMRISIPGRLTSNFPVDANSVEIDVGAASPAPFVTFRTSYLAVAVANNGSGADSLTGGQLND